MHHYDFQTKFRVVYDRALGSYKNGAEDAASLLSPDDVLWLQSIGARAQDLFDYVEDAQKYGEPDFETALLVEAVRRDYFLTIQKGSPSATVLDQASMPAKTDAVRGIEWLPRIIPKALAKLRGELPSSLMYGCGGDRNFFKTHDIHPAEFLRVVWAYADEHEKIVDWVVARSSAAK
jgi:hypothetical protein